MGDLIPMRPLSPAEIDTRFEQLLAIQRRLDDPQEQAKPGFDPVALYAAQITLTKELVERGGLSYNDVAQRFAELLRSTRSANADT